MKLTIDELELLLDENQKHAIKAVVKAEKEAGLFDTDGKIWDTMKEYRAATEAAAAVQDFYKDLYKKMEPGQNLHPEIEPNVFLEWMKRSGIYGDRAYKAAEKCLGGLVSEPARRVKVHVVRRKIA